MANPRYSEKKGWTGGDSRRLYAFTDCRTGKLSVAPGGTGYKAGIGPEVSVRPATRGEAEKHWQDPLHSGWKVDDAGTGPVTGFCKRPRRR